MSGRWPWTSSATRRSARACRSSTTEWRSRAWTPSATWRETIRWAKMTSLRRELLLNCVVTYVKLNDAERSEVQAMLEQKEYEDVRRDDWTWAGRLRAEGRDEERKERERERKEVICRERQSLLEIYRG